MPERFDADWLDRRRAADHVAREHGLERLLADWAGERLPLGVLDLGAGSGSNAAFLAPRLPRPQHWRLLDHDAGLVSAAVNELQTIPGVTAEAVIADLSALPEEALGRADIVTAAALLDLVSAAWLDELIASAVHYRLGMLFALTYTGDIRWQPRLDDDGCVREAFNAHQRGDKGFGAALGPDGAAAAAATAARYGCRVVRRPSPWRLGPRDSALQTQLLDGYKTAATEQVPERADAVADWAVARQARIRRGESRLWVGHEDVLALPP